MEQAPRRRLVSRAAVLAALKRDGWTETRRSGSHLGRATIRRQESAPETVAAPV